MTNSPRASPTRRPTTSSRAIDDVLGDLAAGRPMDRLICGDVGFGKTEVALRAPSSPRWGKPGGGDRADHAACRASITRPSAALRRPAGARWAALRLVGARSRQRGARKDRHGEVDIVVGTHALLGKQVTFKNLGLLMIDEEQHFGVKHKERLKQLRADVHVLTLTATPIPRTLQLALSGVRELSLIATPPVDRLAVRTFICPSTRWSIREALLRERYRGGQSFYVCPRIEDLPDAEEFLQARAGGEVRAAHGQMPADRARDTS
jgi:transcription-repair coupling factor (superfamily II helicase)